MLRDTLRVKCENVDKNNQWYHTNTDKFVLRFFYKHREGTLWCFNKPTLDQQYFKEVPNPVGCGVINNKVDGTEE